MKAGKQAIPAVRYIRKIVFPGTVKPILSPRDGSCHQETLANSMMLNNMALEYITQLESTGG
jgi:hypothetical protein